MSAPSSPTRRTPTRSALREEPDRATRTADLFRRARECPGAGERWWEEIVILNLPVADAIAHRYVARGVATEDLEQVARLALVKAVRSFRPELGTDFLGYAVPSITGEVRHYFRDRAWAVRPPRRIQEGQAAIAQAGRDLAPVLGRQPTVPELAAHLGLEEDTVIECLAATSCFRPDCLDRPLDAEHAGETVGSLVGRPDPGFEECEARLTLDAALPALTDQERVVLRLRFVDQLTQQEIGDRIGVTQMQVSRILSGALGRLRTALAG